MNRIVGTITNCKQVGQTEYRDVSISRIFWPENTIKNIDDWAKENNSTFSEVRLSILEGMR